MALTTGRSKEQDRWYFHMRRRVLALCAFLAFLSITIGAVSQNLPWLVAENQRIELRRPI
jgi:hypothetical protein